MTRMAKKDYAIDDTDIVIAKGTRLIIPMHAIHMLVPKSYLILLYFR